MYVQRSKRNDEIELIYNTEADSQTLETNLELLVGCMGGRDDWESGMDMHRFTAMFKVDHPTSTYCTAQDSAQCYTWKREWVHVCLAESLLLSTCN